MKILYVTTISNTMRIVTSHINMLLDKGHTVDMACNILRPINNELLERGCKVHNLNFQRSPLDKRNYDGYKNLKKLIIKEKYDLIHTHTPIASAIVRFICRNMKDVKILYTAHGFHFFKGAPLKNWLIYYPIEKWLSKYTDVLITINQEDFKRAKDNFKAKKVEFITSVGFDVNKYRDTKINKRIKREEIGVPKDGFVIMSVGELNKNKNHRIIIKAIAGLNNPNIHFIICGKGPLENYLKKLSARLGIEKQVHLLGYRSDVAEICKACDIFAFPSLREGLGMAALEAMACGLPIITSNVHGIIDYSEYGKTGYSCNPMDVKGFSDAIKRLLRNKEKCIEIGEYNKKIVEKYDIKNVLTQINRIYQTTI